MWIHEIADRLSRERRLAGETQDDLAKVAGCSTGHVSQVENHIYNWSLDALEKLSSHYGRHRLNILEGLIEDACLFVETLKKMPPEKQQLAVRLCELELAKVEISRNWPS